MCVGDRQRRSPTHKFISTSLLRCSYVLSERINRGDRRSPRFPMQNLWFCIGFNSFPQKFLSLLERRKDLQHFGYIGGDAPLGYARGSVPPSALPDLPIGLSERLRKPSAKRNKTFPRAGDSQIG